MKGKTYVVLPRVAKQSGFEPNLINFIVSKLRYPILSDLFSPLNCASNVVTVAHPTCYAEEDFLNRKNLLKFKSLP